MRDEPLELSPEDREWLKANWHYPSEIPSSLSSNLNM